MIGQEERRDLYAHGQTVIDLDPEDYKKMAIRIRNQAVYIGKKLDRRTHAQLMTYNRETFEPVRIGRSAISSALMGQGQLSMLVYFE